MKKMLHRHALGLLLVLTTTLHGQTPDSLRVINQVDSLLTLCRSFESKGQYNEALGQAVLAETAAVERFGKMHPASANAINRQGVAYQYLGDYEKCGQRYLEAKEIREQVLGKNHMDYARSINNLGNYYSETGAYEKAIAFHLESLAIRAKLVGKNNADYARALNNLAGDYLDMGLYASAEPLYKEALEIQANKLGKNNTEYALALRNLGYLYYEMGDYPQSEHFSLSAKEAYLEIYGAEHDQYSYPVFNLGQLYIELDQDAKAEQFIQQALAIRAKTLGKEHVEYAYALNQLARLRGKQYQFDQAAALFQKSLQILEKRLGQQHANYAWVLRSLADLSFYSKRYPEAMATYNQVIALQKQTLGAENYQYAWTLYQLGQVYSQLGQDSMAAHFYVEALAITEKSVGQKHPNYFAILGSLASTYAIMGKKEKADALFTTASALNQARMQQSATYLSADEMAKYVAGCPCQSHLTDLFSYAGARVREAPQLMDILWDNTLFYKGLIFENTRAIERAAAIFPDSLKQIHANWKILQSLIAAEYSKPFAERRDLKALEENAAQLEKNLARAVPGFVETRRRVSWREVRQQLRHGEVAIEFTHFQNMDGLGNSIENDAYAAILLTRDDTLPRFIPLFEEKQLAALLARTHSRPESIEALYANRSGILDEKTPAYGAELYALLWKPLETALRGAKTVYFSPSGLLHRVNLAALPTGKKGKTLADRYALRRLGSTRNLVAKTPQPQATHYVAALFGGVYYDSDSAALSGQTLAHAATGENTGKSALAYAETARNGNGTAFPYLPGTQTEVDRIEALMRRTGMAARTITGNHATEESLKAFGKDGVKSPEILHIATHGYFFDDPQKREKQRGDGENTFRWNENPLFRSGLALAGANHAWTGGHSWANLEDGICTAYEISHLNLSNTQLAVLSACETGLGDIKGSEGVYGLQRAFKMAGVGHLIVSLWKVPDERTAEFMELFYGHWLGGKPIHEAFAKAQKKMKKKYGVYEWGAWVLVE